MDFGALPPEINSARMYSGPGSGPLLAAAAAWHRLGEEVSSLASSYRSLIAELTTESWRGPSSTAMANAAMPYVAWLHGTAAQAEQTATRAQTAAGAFQSAHAAVVPPAAIAANRSHLLTLVATNYFGQNSPMIAVVEADYDAMWAQDTAVMNGYAAASATAASMAPFTTPPTTVSPAATTALAATAVQAVGGSAQGELIGSFTLVDAFNDTVSSLSGAASVSSSSFGGASIATTNHAISINAERDDHQGVGPFLGLGSPPVMPSPTAAALSSSVRPAVTAFSGRASIAGALSVPQAWAATVPGSTVTVAPAATPLSSTAISAAPVQPGMFGEAMLGTLAGRGVNAAAARTRRPTVIPRSPAAG